MRTNTEQCPVRLAALKCGNLLEAVRQGNDLLDEAFPDAYERLPDGQLWLNYQRIRSWRHGVPLKQPLYLWELQTLAAVLGVRWSSVREYYRPYSAFWGPPVYDRLR